MAESPATVGFRPVFPGQRAPQKWVVLGLITRRSRVQIPPATERPGQRTVGRGFYRFAVGFSRVSTFSSSVSTRAFVGPLTFRVSLWGVAKVAADSARIPLIRRCPSTRRPRVQKSLCPRRLRRSVYQPDPVDESEPTWTVNPALRHSGSPSWSRRALKPFRRSSSRAWGARTQ